MAIIIPGGRERAGLGARAHRVHAAGQALALALALALTPTLTLTLTLQDKSDRASETLAKREGMCTNKANLQVALLRAAGITLTLTRGGEGRRG